MSRHRLNKLFLGGLPEDVEQDEIYKIFHRYGEIIDLVVIRDKVTRLNRGFGFVTFREASAMQAAFKGDNILRGAALQVRIAAPKKVSQIEKAMDVSHVRKVFIGGIPKEVTPSYFRSHFEQYGPVSEAILVQDRETGELRGFGFVTFKQAGSVADVMYDYSNHCLMGKWVDCKVALPRQWELEGCEAPAQSDRHQYNCEAWRDCEPSAIYGHRSWPNKCENVKDGNSTKFIFNRKIAKTHEKDKLMPPGRRQKIKKAKLTKVLHDTNLVFKVARPHHLNRSIRVKKLLAKTVKLELDTKYSYFYMSGGVLQQVKTSRLVPTESLKAKDSPKLPEAELVSDLKGHLNCDMQSETSRNNAQLECDRLSNALPFSLSDWKDPSRADLFIPEGERTNRFCHTPSMGLRSPTLLKRKGKQAIKKGDEQGDDTSMCLSPINEQLLLKVTTPRTMRSTEPSSQNTTSEIVVMSRNCHTSKNRGFDKQHSFATIQRVIQEEMDPGSSDEGEDNGRPLLSDEDEFVDKDVQEIKLMLRGESKDMDMDKQTLLDCVELQTLVVLPPKQRFKGT